MSSSSLKVKVQSVGRFLSGMILPNIGAFIAWGLITALFIPTGWLPNEKLAVIVGPMISYLLPILIAYTGGKIVHGKRGAVIASIAVMGVVAGTDKPMFLAAMIVGPLAALVIKYFDKFVEGKIKAGFEMLVNNFSIGIIGMLLALLSLVAIEPAFVWLLDVLSVGIQFLVDKSLLPFVNIFVEPAKILFLNNAINHGIFSPLAAEQVKEVGKSVLYLVEANPGPGLGLLMAISLFGKGTAKETAPGAVIIHFFGGIHEIYFPYVLMKPKLLIGLIVSGVSATFTFSILDVGLSGPPSPGSIFAVLGMAAKGSTLGVLIGVTISTIISFVICSIIIKAEKSESEDTFEESQKRMLEMKAESKGTIISKGKINLVVFACDAGMGSSAMGATILKKKFKDNGINVKVLNKAINELKDDADIVITHLELTNRAKSILPNAIHISVENFLNSPEYNRVVEIVKSSN